MNEELLIEKFKNGDILAAGSLVSLNEALVKAIFSRHYGSNTSAEDDFLQEGRLGVLEACKRYDPTKSKQFGYYKSIWIRKKMNRLFQKENRFKIKKKAKENELKFAATRPVQGVMHDVLIMLDYNNLSDILPKKDHDKLIHAAVQYKTTKDEAIYSQLNSCR